MEKIKIYAFADEASSMIDGQIAAMKRNGLDGLEIRNVDGVNVAEITSDKAKEVKRKLDSNGLITWSVGSPIGKIDIEKDDFSAHLEKLKRTLETANILDTKNIRMFSFYMPEGKDLSVYKNEVIDRLGVMCDTARAFGVKLAHENEKGIYGDTPERCLELFKALPELCGIFDPANFVQCGVDTLAAWDILGEHIAYMHIKDAEKSGTIVPAGEGDGNIAQLAKRYIAAGGTAFTMEPHLIEFDGLAQLEREGEKSEIADSRYSDSDTAFDTACDAFKKLL